MIAGTLAAVGRPVLQAVAAMGRVTLFAGAILGHILRPPFSLRELGTSLLQLGWYSLPVVGLTAIFTGGALALQPCRNPSTAARSSRSSSARLASTSSSS